MKDEEKERAKIFSYEDMQAKINLIMDGRTSPREKKQYKIDVEKQIDVLLNDLDDSGKQINILLDEQKDRIKGECGTAGWLGWELVILWNLKYILSWQCWIYIFVGGLIGATTGILSYMIIYPLIIKRGIFGRSWEGVNIPSIIIWGLQIWLAFYIGSKTLDILLQL